jgi:hypothetical protein
MLSNTGGQLQQGDQVQISVPKDAAGNPAFDLNSLQPNFVSSGDIFKVTIDRTTGNDHPDLIHITATRDVPYDQLAKAGFSIFIKTTAKTAAGVGKVQTYSPVRVDFIPVEGNPTNHLNESINIKPELKGGATPDGIGNQIFGGFGGLAFPQGFNPVGNDRFNANYWCPTNPDDEFHTASESLVYSFTQPATASWAQITLPTDPKRVPKTLTWKLSTDDPVTHLDYRFLSPKSLSVYKANPDGTFSLQPATLTVSPDEKQVTFTLSGLAAGVSYNIPFSVGTFSSTSRFQVTSHIEASEAELAPNVDNNGNKIVEMKYNHSVDPGYVPDFKPRHLTMTLADARKMLYDNQQLKADQVLLPSFYSDLKDINNQPTTDTVHFGSGFDKTTLDYDQLKNNQTYEIPLYAANQYGVSAVKTATLTIADSSQTALAGQFIDVDTGKQVQADFTLNRPDNVDIGDLSDVQTLMTDQNISIPAGYHYATASELKNNQAQSESIKWGSTPSPIKVYIKKNVNYGKLNGEVIDASTGQQMGPTQDLGTGNASQPTVTIKAGDDWITAIAPSNQYTVDGYTIGKKSAANPIRPLIDQAQIPYPTSDTTPATETVYVYVTKKAPVVNYGSLNAQIVDDQGTILATTNFGQGSEVKKELTINKADQWIQTIVAKGYTVSGWTAGQKNDANPLQTTWPAKVAYPIDGTTRTIYVYVSKKATPTPNPTPNPTPTPVPTPNPTPTPSPTPTSTTPTTTTTTQPAEPAGTAKIGEAVYALKKVYMYQHNTFKVKERQACYVSKPRIYRPMFVVTGYAHSKNGHLRYKVRDVNHLSKNKNKRGYITAQWAYIRPVYYHSQHQTLTVINPRGVNAYKRVNLTGKVKHYKQGTILHVTKFVHHNLTTRYVLNNGNYITGNRKLIEMGRHKQVRYVTVKKTLNRYRTVNLTHRNKVHIKKGTKLKVSNFDYSHANSVTTHGALRYHMSGGYITGSSKFVKVDY